MSIMKKLVIAMIIASVLITVIPRPTQAFALTITAKTVLISVLIAGGIGFLAYESMTGATSAFINSLSADVIQTLNWIADNAVRLFENRDGEMVQGVEISLQQAQLIWEAAHLHFHPYANETMTRLGNYFPLLGWLNPPANCPFPWAWGRAITGYYRTVGGLPVLQLDQVFGEYAFQLPHDFRLSSGGLVIRGHQVDILTRMLQDYGLPMETTWRNGHFRMSPWDNGYTGVWFQSAIDIYWDGWLELRYFTDGRGTGLGTSRRHEPLGLMLLEIPVIEGEFAHVTHNLVAVYRRWEGTTITPPLTPPFPIRELVFLPAATSALAIGLPGRLQNVVSIMHFAELETANIVRDITDAQARALTIAGTSDTIAIRVPDTVGDLVGAVPETIIIGAQAGTGVIPDQGLLDRIWQGILDILAAIMALPGVLAGTLQNIFFSDDLLPYVPVDMDFDFRINLMDYFPFSIPRDIFDIFGLILGTQPAALLGATTHERALFFHYQETGHLSDEGHLIIAPMVFPDPILPRFEVNIPLPSFAGGRIDSANESVVYTWVLDMADYPRLIAIINWSVLVAFLFGLMQLTAKFITW